MHNPVFEHLDTLSFAFMVYIILYIDDKQFRCSLFTFVQYITALIHLKVSNVYNVMSCGIMVKRILAVCCISFNDFKAIVMSIYKNLV